MTEARRQRSWWHLHKMAFFAIDCVLLGLAVQAAYHLSPRWVNNGEEAGQWIVSFGLPLAMALGLLLAGVQVNQSGFRGPETLTRILAGSIAGMFCFVVLHAVVGFELVGRYILGITLVQGVTSVLISRWVIWKLAEKGSRELFFLGSETTYRETALRVTGHRLPIRFVGQASWRAAVPGEAAARSGPAALTATQRTGEFVVENPDALAPGDRQSLLGCMAQGARIIDLGYFYEAEFEMVHVDSLRASWFWSYEPADVRPVYFACKRGVDVALSLLGLLVSTPAGALIALCIAIQDRGPVIYSQIRVGIRNKPFKIYKFRTMRIGAEENGPCWAEPDDDRVTVIGRFLRKTRLDELPQFWNILKGDMSFIGPRPERPEIIERIEAELPYYRFRHIVKPGLTGWAQVNYPYGASIEDSREKLAYDLFYIKYGSSIREMDITLRTIVAMVRGAR
jgi:exopolysaccharide biosynthesis polyprenyl glycosylphosphotransferase